MKKFWIIALSALFLSSSASAVNMVNIHSYLNVPIRIIGLPDFPPFSYYENPGREYEFHSIFLAPLKEVLQKHDVDAYASPVSPEEANDVRILLIRAKKGDAEAFIGAYADTKLFSGLDVIYPAVISNPIHIITLEDTQEKIKNVGDLLKLRGIACKSEYFSDFVLRKFKELNISYVDTPFEAYEAVITGKADYMFGSMYYNRIMASRYGVGDYLKYSKNPIWNIPFFVALSKLMPMLSEYKKVLKEEFENPDFAMTIKQKILDAVNEEVDKNIGIVPPSFVQEIEQKYEVTDEENGVEEDAKVSSGHIVEQKIHQKTIDEVLDGI